MIIYEKYLRIVKVWIWISYTIPYPLKWCNWSKLLFLWIQTFTSFAPFFINSVTTAISSIIFTSWMIVFIIAKVIGFPCGPGNSMIKAVCNWWNYVGMVLSTYTLHGPHAGSKHSHLVQYFVFTFGPQQSPPSHSHPSLLFLSSHHLSPFQFGAAHPAGGGGVGDPPHASGAAR